MARHYNTIPLKNSINILGVEVDSRLRFDHYLEKVVRIASQKVTLLCRMKHLLYADGLLTLYKTRVRPAMEYASLTWMLGARCNLNLLDKMQRQAKHLIRGARQ